MVLCTTAIRGPKFMSNMKTMIFSYSFTCKFTKEPTQRNIIKLKIFFLLFMPGFRPTRIQLYNFNSLNETSQISNFLIDHSCQNVSFSKIFFPKH